MRRIPPRESSDDGVREVDDVEPDVLLALLERIEQAVPEQADPEAETR